MDTGSEWMAGRDVIARTERNSESREETTAGKAGEKFFSLLGLTSYTSFMSAIGIWSHGRRNCFAARVYVLGLEMMEGLDMTWCQRG